MIKLLFFFTDEITIEIENQDNKIKDKKIHRAQKRE